jgi:hypothetical protein
MPETFATSTLQQRGSMMHNTMHGFGGCEGDRHLGLQKNLQISGIVSSRHLCLRYDSTVNL